MAYPISHDLMCCLFGNINTSVLKNKKEEEINAKTFYTHTSLHLKINKYLIKLMFPINSFFLKIRVI